VGLQEGEQVIESEGGNREVASSFLMTNRYLELDTAIRRLVVYYARHLLNIE
jgi:hypothetical protein